MIPIQNEIMSVRDVMVMETAASERVFAILISTLDLGEVRLHAANITNVSSIPIPVNIERTRELGMYHDNNYTCQLSRCTVARLRCGVDISLIDRLIVRERIVCSARAHYL